MSTQHESASMNSGPQADVVVDIAVRDLVSDIRKAKWKIALTAFGFALAGGLYGFFSDKQYEASIVVIPVSVDANHTGGLSALAGQFGGIASLAGGSLGSEKKSEALAVLQSELLTEKYLHEQNLLPILYASQWDSAKQQWITKDSSKVPTLWLANRYFKREIRSVSEDRLTGIVTLRIRWKDPRLAAKWANDLIANTNAYLRNKAIIEAQHDIDYLNDQASKTTILEAKEAVYTLLKEQINNEMVARGREDYALKVIDPAFAPEKPASLGTIALSALGFFSGVLISVFAALARRIMSQA